MVWVMLREDLFECNVCREAGRVQKLNAIVVYPYDTRGSAIEIVPVDEHIQKCFAERGLRILGNLLSPERVDNCVAGRVVDDRLRCKKILFCKFQKLEEIPGKVFWVDEYGFTIYSGDLEPCIFETGLRILSEENACSMGDISIRGDQAKASEDGFFVFYVGYPGTYSTAPDKIHEVPYCLIVNIVEGTTAHEILPVGVFQKLSPEFVRIDLPDGIADPGVITPL